MSSLVPFGHDSFELNNGTKIPAVGVGCWMGQPGGANEVRDMVEYALKIGYRHIDTAFAYGNEEDVGKAIRNSGIRREEIYLVTKLIGIHHGDVETGLQMSLEKLGVKYIDLYLMHWPQARDPVTGRVPGENEHPTFVETWKDMEKLLASGKVKAIGVSNFSVQNLNILLPKADIVPAVNQVEMHPLLPQLELLEYCNKSGILLTAYTPLGKGRPILMEHPVLTQIAARHGCTTSQVIMGWLKRKGVVAIPKSGTPTRLQQNLQYVEISAEDEAHIDTIHKAPGMHRSMTAYHDDDGTVFGWTYQQLGWSFKRGGIIS